MYRYVIYYGQAKRLFSVLSATDRRARFDGFSKVHILPRRKTAQREFIRERERRKTESVLRSRVEIFAAVPSAAAEARARRNARETLRDLSLYIVHCNYNLYLLVIDTLPVGYYYY